MPASLRQTGKHNYMQKLLIYALVFASAGLSACGSVDRIPFVYRIDVQQGNVSETDMINQLRPGMSRSQVRYVMGTPLIADPFHQDRWDYIYRMYPGKGKAEQYRITLYFDGDILQHISGDRQPDPNAANADPQAEITTVVVPAQERKARGILTRIWNWFGYGKENGA